jgi:hypothetical protein
MSSFLGNVANAAIIVPMLFVGFFGTTSLFMSPAVDSVQLHGKVGRS